MIKKSVGNFFLVFIALLFGSITYAEDSLADKLTIITSTSWIPSNPSTEMLEITQNSLFIVPEFRNCKQIIVFDGVPSSYHRGAMDAYELYIQNVESLVKEHPDFANVILVINKEHKHLALSLKEAFLYVDTPYVFVHQHDFALIRPIDIMNLIKSMDENPNLKHIRINRLYNTANHFDGEVDEVIVGGSYVPLIRTFGWSDNDHVTRTDYYHNFVFPKIVSNGAMEWFLHDRRKIEQDHLSYGTYIYGTLNESDPYLYHLDGRSYRAKR